MRSIAFPGSAVKRLLVHAPPPLVDELADRGVDVVALYYPWFRPADQTHARLRAGEAVDPRAKLDLGAIRRLRRLMDAHRPELVHAFSPKSLAAAVLATSGMRAAPAIVSFRGISTPPAWFDPANHVTFLSGRVRAHACESDAVAAGLVCAGVPADRCHTVYNCVRQPGGLSAEDRAAIRSRFGIPIDAFLIGTIAHVRPVKGTDILLQAGLDCLDLDAIHCLVIGQVDDRTVERLAADPRWRGRLHMAGRVDGAGALAGAFDVFAMPSRHEGLCRALLEAMSWGTCPVVSDAGGMKEMVRHGRDGLVVPRENVAAFAEAIRLLHADRFLTASFGESARRRIAEVCTPRAFADRVLAVHARAAA